MHDHKKYQYISGIKNNSVGNILSSPATCLKLVLIYVHEENMYVIRTQNERCDKHIKSNVYPIPRCQFWGLAIITWKLYVNTKDAWTQPSSKEPNSVHRRTFTKGSQFYLATVQSFPKAAQQPHEHFLM